jgi:Alginate lyase
MNKLLFLLIFTFVINCLSAQNAPKTLLLDGAILAKNKAAIAQNDADKTAALKSLCSKAEKILKSGKVYSVMHKKKTPPSGDKHDYMSIGPYWWPDPSKPDGLPYIRRDGEINPEYHDIPDTDEMDKVADESSLLALAYYFTGEERFAEHAARILRTWFLDTATRQNPNLNFGQAIPGLNTGRGIGIIESRCLTEAIDAALLLEGAKNWTKEDHAGLQKWFADYTKWLIENPLGQDEAAAKNNHGTHYDAQVISYALFTGQTELAKKQLETTRKRIQSQLTPEGSQPHELERTLSWNYSNMNLKGFLDIAVLAEKVGVDLWKFETQDGKSLKKAVDWLVPYLKNERAWTYKQIKERDLGKSVGILMLAAKAYNNAEYDQLAKAIDAKTYQANVTQLTH